MRAFSKLIDGLLFSPQRNTKLALLERYFREAPDPDRGWALAALSDGLDLPGAKPAMIRELVLARVDAELFRWSYDYVGDLAETVSLIWPRAEDSGPPDPPRLSQVVDGLGAAGRAGGPKRIEAWLDRSAAEERYALLKLVMGGMRVGVSARLAKTALARLGSVPVAEIEELWHGLAPPYTELFAWLEGRADRPDISGALVFRPLMLANPLDGDDPGGLDPAAYRAEWKWDGIRVQLAAGPGGRKLFSRTGDDISGAFPDIIEAMTFHGVLDGELLVTRPGPTPPEIAPFNALQQRLNRKTVSAKQRKTHPAWVRLYDLLLDGDRDVRGLGFDDRRAALERFFDRHRPDRMDLSGLVPFDSWEDLATLRAGARDAAIEGLMLKRADSLYLPGRPKGPWFKWKRAPLTADCVLLYAQRGHGKRSSFYSDFTFGAWREGEGDPELVPVGKAYSGFTDAELARLDRWVRANTTERFGPVRAVTPELVVEVAFDSIHPSPRHKSGVAMRFPRFHRIRWDKPAREADRLDSLEALITG